MKKLRSLFYFLLAANLVLAAFLMAPALGLQDIGGSGGEPERMANQLHTENIRVFPEGFEPVARTAAAVAVAQVAAASPTPQASTQTCVAYQSLSAEQARTLAERARAFGEPIGVSEGGADSYWVSIPPQGGKAGAERRAKDLREMGIEDFFIVQDSGAAQYAVSLGLYHTETAARRQLESLQKKGLTTARVSVRQNAGPTTRIELTGSSEVLQRLGQELTDKFKGAEQAACQAG